LVISTRSTLTARPEFGGICDWTWRATNLNCSPLVSKRIEKLLVGAVGILGSEGRADGDQNNDPLLAHGAGKTSPFGVLARCQPSVASV
jgi:hypothetical protein